MDNQVDEDAIDTETLQAQIDLSMSFAQNLVSSWVKPSSKLRKRSSKDTESELREYMRRPPRLGVGAPIPEAQSLSRETARLKGQLLGKRSKRTGEDYDAKKEEEEEESRAGAIKKKIRVDPFAGGNGKKRKRRKGINQDSILSRPVDEAGPAYMPRQSDAVQVITDTSSEGDDKLSSTNLTIPEKESPSHRKVAIPLVPAETSTLNTSLAGVLESGSVSCIPTVPAELPLNSFTTSPIIAARLRRLSQSTEVLKHPLLNLAPPPNDEVSDDTAKAEASVSGSKKKRRRRKKKKNTQAHTST